MKTTLSSLDQHLNTLYRKVQKERRTVMLGLLTCGTICGVWLTSCQHPRVATKVAQTLPQVPGTAIPVVPSPAFQLVDPIFHPSKSPAQRTQVPTLSEKEIPEAKPIHPNSRQTKRLVVMKGDTLWTIAKKAGVSLAALKRTNGLKNDNIRVGQSLSLP